MTKLGKNIKTKLTFHYVGKNKFGQKITGNIKAKSLILAKMDLRKRGVMIHKITQKRFSILFRKKITAGDIALFSRQLATLIESGIPLVHAFDIIAKGQSNEQLQNLLQEIKHDIENGLTYSEALIKHPTYFNGLFCNLIHAGEESGSLSIMLNKVATYKEKIESIKKKIKKAITYPIATITIAIIVTLSLLIFVVPQFEILFKAFGADLPILTQIVIKISKYVQSYWYWFLGALGMLTYVFIYIRKYSPELNQYIDSILLKLPIIGPIIEKTIIARFSRTLSITFASGLSLIDSFKSVAGVVGNIVFLHAIEYIQNEISSGQSINKAMEQTHLFPHMVIQMITAGEESGTLEKMLNKVADLYEEDVDNFVDSLGDLLEPIIMSLLGILVGGLIIAMYLPIFKLGSAI